MNVHQQAGFSVDALTRSIAQLEGYKSLGWGTLDARGIAVGPGELVIAAGRTGHGKTAVLVNLLAHWLQTYPNESFLFVSLEIPPADLLLRLLSIYARKLGHVGWAHADIKRHVQSGGRHVPDTATADGLAAAIDAVRSVEHQIVAVYEPDWSVGDIEAFTASVAQQRRIGGILVDYLQLVGPPAGQYWGRDAEVAVVARLLKRTAVDMHCPLVAGAQITSHAARASAALPKGSLDDQVVMEAIAKRRPQLHYLGQGGGEQEADIVLGLLNYQADYLAAQNETEDAQIWRRETDGAGPFEVSVIKNRHGELGSAMLVLEARNGFIRDPGVLGR